MRVIHSAAAAAAAGAVSHTHIHISHASTLPHHTAGYDCWWSLHRLFPKIIGGARRHHIHHKNGNNGNYQQFFMFLDDIMGTSTDNDDSTIGMDGKEEKVAKKLQ